MLLTLPVFISNALPPDEAPLDVFPFEVFELACGCTGCGVGACVMGRMAASICGRSICPNGVLRTVCGSDVMWSGIPLPTRNMAKSLEKLLQLCANRS